MSIELPSFDVLWKNYPAGSAILVKKSIGGHVDASWITNTCVIRTSNAFNESGSAHRIPGPSNSYGLHVVSGANKKWFAYRVAEFKNYMNKRYGAPNLTVNNPGGKVPDAFKGQKGVICFLRKFEDATGHFDIWDGTTCKYNDYFSDTAVSTVHLWLTTKKSNVS